MGNQLVWQERYNIGVDSIDKEHKKLFGILNRMLIYRKQGEKSQWVCQEGIKYFKDHAMKHFTDEEAYMASIDYVGFETHRRLHDNFRRKTLPALEKELKQTAYSSEAVNHFLGVCAGWLFGHTLIEDRAITRGIMSKWSDLLPDADQTTMEKTIFQLLYDLFGVNAKVISECYGGEKFGKGIYYRLVYDNKQDKQWETIFVFEEKVILNTIGNIMSTKSDTVNVMLMNAVRYTAQQFVAGIIKQFPSTELYEMKEENLLTYEQFQKSFDERKPQFSLLFDTGKGYFAYCAVAPHLIEDEHQIPIKAENAMVEIKKYLNARKEEPKKRILVVDDSDFARQAMKQLLENDYEVLMANSGLSAIRAIALNQPDLVLLDYEMPVCNGSQVLEMIRSEEDFRDIAVIFLTSRDDKESVEKVLSLRPTGYLLKTLKPAEIKKGIDNYFKKENKEVK